MVVRRLELQARRACGDEHLSVMRRERNSQHHAQQHFCGAVAVWECEFEQPYA